MNIAWFLVFVAIYVVLIWKSGKTYPILYLFLFVYFLQYLYATYLIYNEFPSLSKFMTMGQEQYFEYAIPAIVSLFAGIFVFNRDVDLRNHLSKIDPKQSNQFGFLLLSVAYGTDLAAAVGISSLNSILSFTQYLKYIGAFAFLFSQHKMRYLIIGFVYTQSMYAALTEGIFIDFFVWATFLFFFVSLRFQFPFWLRISFIAIAMPVLVLVQSVKQEYREVVWNGGGDAGLGTLTELARNSAPTPDDDSFLHSKGMTRTIARLTQGWHLSLTMQWVPRKEPFSNGSEMLSDVASSILPRVLFADKKLAATRDKFEQYTGYRLQNRTSMTIGVLGDFYINFGPEGSLVMLFIFGAMISRLFYYFTSKVVISDPIQVIWIPFLLNYLVRANNDFYTAFNSSLKGILIFLFLNFVRQRLWRKSNFDQKPALGVR
jgi:hypothetical protein